MVATVCQNCGFTRFFNKLVVDGQMHDAEAEPAPASVDALPPLEEPKVGE